MRITPILTAYAVWSVWGVAWLVAGLWVSRTVSRSTMPGTRWTLAVAALGFLGLFAEAPGRFHPLWHLPDALGWAMAASCAAGALFAGWARIGLGALWSGGIVRREGHRLVDGGPYAIVRHPIYTGLIAAALALAAIKASPLAIAGALLLTIGFALKARVEERFLGAELGEAAYAAYRARVPMLMPFARG